MVLLQLDDVYLQLRVQLLALLVVVAEGGLRNNAGLLPKHLVGAVRLVARLLELAELAFDLEQLDVQLLHLVLLALVLLGDVLILLAGVRQDDHRGHNLLPQLVQLFVPLLNLLVEGLVLDLELLEVDEVEAVCELLLLLENLLLVGESVAQSNVLKAVLVDFLIATGLVVLPLLDDLGLELLTGAREDCVVRDCGFEFLELVLYFLALGLLLVEFGLQLGSHAVVPVLGLLEVEADLVDIGQRVQVLVLVQKLLRLLLLAHRAVLKNDLALQVVVLALQRPVFVQFVADCLDQLALHLRGAGQVADAVFVAFVLVVLVLLVVVVEAFGLTVLAAFPSAVGARDLARLVGLLASAGVVVLAATAAHVVHFDVAPLPGCNGLLLLAVAFFLPGQLLGHLDQSLLLRPLGPFRQIAFKSLSVCLVLNHRAWVGDVLHGHAKSQLEVLDLDALVGIGLSSVLDFVHLGRAHVDLEHRVVVEHVVQRAFEVDGKLTSLLVDLEVPRAHKRDVLLEVVHAHDARSIETHFVVQNASPYFNAAVFRLAELTDHGWLLTNQLYNLHLVGVLSEAHPDVGGVFGGELREFVLQFKQ